MVSSGRSGYSLNQDAEEDICYSHHELSGLCNVGQLLSVIGSA